MLDLISDNVRMLKISQIRRDGGTQPRDGIDLDHMQDIQQAIRDGANLPPIEVMYDGQSYWLWDGYHRTGAHEAEGLIEILAIVHQGKLEDAQWESYGVNKGHGLKRTNADKQRQTRNAIKHPNAANKSNEQIAAHVGVDAKTVAKYRSEMAATLEIPESTERTGKDGRKLNTANIGKRPAAAPSPSIVERVLADVDAAHSVSPTLRPLTADETMSLVWRVVKAAKLPLATTPATTGLRWQQYRDWLSRYTVVADYSHEAPAGTQLDRQTLAAARQAIIAELDKNIGLVRKEAATELQLPPFPVADRELFVGQAKRAIKLLDEEGCASVADFLRAICRSL